MQPEGRLLPIPDRGSRLQEAVIQLLRSAILKALAPSRTSLTYKLDCLNGRSKKREEHSRRGVPKHREGGARRKAGGGFDAQALFRDQR